MQVLKLTTSAVSDSIIAWSVPCHLSEANFCCSQLLDSIFNHVLFQTCYGRQGPRALTIYRSQLVRRQNQLEVDLCLLNLRPDLGKLSFKKNSKKKGTLSTSGGRGSTPVPFLMPNLPDSQITQKWTFDTTI